MAHRAPDTPLWPLAARSRALWSQLVQQQPQLAAAMEWQVGAGVCG